jgi:methyltransferase family protein
MRVAPIIKGALTCIPGVHEKFARKRNSGTASAAYCYEVWLKHLTYLWENGMRVIPETVAELGPGSSLGIGLAALLSGAKRYYALDVVKHADTERNLSVLDELFYLFQRRAGRPEKGWPDYDRYLDSNLFPSHILSEKVLESSVTTTRLESFRKAIIDANSGDGPGMIAYMVPWNHSAAAREQSVDLIISHSVLEHVTDLEATYKACSLWLRPKGWMSHQIDFKSHDLTPEWNGYWSYPEGLWKIVVGTRPYLINRQPCSTHVSLMERNGFNVMCRLEHHREDGAARSRLARQWRHLSDDDFTCSGAFIQAVKA